jgi:hypothetical protein
MIYRKNLWAWEQWLRVVIGVALAICGIWIGKGALVWDMVALSGAGLALTGVFGFCPACALGGRKPVAQPMKRKGRE